MVVDFILMQKLINALAVISFGVSAAVVAGGAYVYVNKDTIVDNIKQEALDSMKDLLGGSQIGSALINGSSGVDVTDEALGADSALPIPAIPF